MHKSYNIGILTLNNFKNDIYNLCTVPPLSSSLTGRFSKRGRASGRARRQARGATFPNSTKPWPGALFLYPRGAPVPIINFCQKKSEKRTKKWVKIDKFLFFTFYGVFSQFILTFSKKYRVTGNECDF